MNCKPEAKLDLLFKKTGKTFETGVLAEDPCSGVNNVVFPSDSTQNAT